MISRFQNSSLMEKDGEYRPLLFVSSGPDKGRPEPFPVGSKQRRNSMPNGAMQQPGVTGTVQQQQQQGAAMPMQQGTAMPLTGAMNGAMSSVVPAAAVCASSGVQQLQQQQQQGRDSRCVSAVSAASIMN
jgi:hypothetical protein